MNSPATALIWEIWRKNRWGFAVLLVLFAACAALSFALNRVDPLLQAEAHRIERENFLHHRAGNPLMQGTVRMRDWWPTTAAHQTAREARFELNRKVIYQGLLSPNDTLLWSVSGSDISNPRGVRLSLGSQVLYDSPVGSEAILSWRVSGSEKRGQLVLDPGLPSEARLGEIGLARARAEAWQGTGLVWSWVMLTFSVYVVFAIFGCTEPHAARGFTGIPPRRFALPVRTRTLVVWPTVFGCVTLLLLFFAWSRLVLKPLLPTGMTMPDFYLAMLLLAGLAVFQALVWGLPSYPKTRAVLIILLVLGLSPLAVLPFSMQTAGGLWPERWSSWQHNLTQLFAVAWVSGVAAAWFGVSQERLGGWAGWQRTSRIADFAREWTPRPLDFWSLLHAQLWIEWRRNCRVQLGVWMFVVGICLGVVCLLGSSSGQFFFSGLGDAIDFLKTVGLMACVAIMGLNLARDGSSGKLALSSFTATRPIRTGDLLAAKVLAGLATWTLAVSVLGVAAMLVAAVAAPLGHPLWTELIRRQDLQTLVFILAFALNVFVGILPMSLSGKFPGFPWSLLPLLLIYFGVLNAFAWFERHNQWFGLLFILLVVAVVLKLLVAVWGFRRALALRLVSGGLVAGYVVVWLLGASLFALLEWLLVVRANFAGDTLFMMPVAILVLPLARIALAPLALAINRHR